MSIALTGGGTLGSVIPLLSLVSYKPNEGYIWIGTTHGPEKSFVQREHIPFYAVPSYKLRRYFSLKTISELPHILTGYRNAKKILTQHDIKIVVSAGGYISVPVCYAAHILGIPYIILQLDYTPGLANNILAKNASAICTSLEKHNGDFTSAHVHWTGIPTSRSKKETTLHSDKPILLVLGGGTGSTWLNNFVVRSLPSLLRDYVIIHIFGSSSRMPQTPKTYNNYYARASVDHDTLLSYIHQSTLVVSRAGMGSLAEISHYAKPSLLIPIPGSHQKENAELFCSKEAALCYFQERGYSGLLHLIRSVMQSKSKQETLSKNIQHVLPQNAHIPIWKLITQCIKE